MSWRMNDTAGFLICRNHECVLLFVLPYFVGLNMIYETCCRVCASRNISGTYVEQLKDPRSQFFLGMQLLLSTYGNRF